jgi:hypothetical protein
MVGAGEKPLEHVPQVRGDYFEGVWSAIMLSLLLHEMQVNYGFYLNGLHKLDLKAVLAQIQDRSDRCCMYGQGNHYV